jgi:hypothetical protein
MPTLDQHPSLSVVRLLNMGDNGTGKTGALASLVVAGYHLYILDFESGIDIIANALRQHYKDDPDGLKGAMQRVTYESLKDPVNFTATGPRIKDATAWKRASEALKSWGVENFTARDVVVIDTLGSASAVALNHAAKVGARLNARLADQDYGWMADSMFVFIDALTDDTNLFNLVVNAHIRIMHGKEEVTENNRGQEVPAGALKGLPNAKGQQIPREIGRYFNTIVTSYVQGTGSNAKRFISTAPQGIVAAKTSNPWTVKPKYDVESGLAELFSDILGGPLPSPPAP